MMKKTITPVISVILLIMLTIAVSGTAWYWVNSLQANLESNTNEQIDSTSDLGSTQFIIDAIPVVCNKSSNVTIMVMNVGSTAIPSTSVAIISLLSSSGEVLDTMTTTLGTTLETSGTSSIGYIRIPVTTGNWNSSLTYGESYQIRVNLNSMTKSTSCTATQ